MRWGFGGASAAHFDAYLQFITASFTVYLLPTLSQLTRQGAITGDRAFAEIRAAGGSGSGYGLGAARLRYLAAVLGQVCRHAQICLHWQLVGDVLKVRPMCSAIW